VAALTVLSAAIIAARLVRAAPFPLTAAATTEFQRQERKMQTGKLGTTAKTIAASLVATAAVALAGAGSTPAHAQGSPSGPPAAAPAAAARQTPAQRLMGDVAPKLADLTDTVLFGDVWERPSLSKRDRSLVTVSALIAMNRPDQLRSHLAIARNNGVTEEELVEAITHLAFYAGWPSAVTAVGIAREVFQKK
jgi:4-carboxymuconolactone decarboxylase